MTREERLRESLESAVEDFPDAFTFNIDETEVYDDSTWFVVNAIYQHFDHTPKHEFEFCARVTDGEEPEMDYYEDSLYTITTGNLFVWLFFGMTNRIDNPDAA